jgi:hypothetical protein
MTNCQLTILLIGMAGMLICVCAFLADLAERVVLTLFDYLDIEVEK